MPNITYKERLIIKANIRINRLYQDRMSMVKNTSKWHAKTREIGQEKEHIKNLREGTATIDNHPVRSENATI